MLMIWRNEIKKLDEQKQQKEEKKLTKVEFCEICKKTYTENAHAVFTAKHERLLKDIERDKEDLAVLAKKLEELENQARGRKEIESVQQIFNIQDLGSMQELLEQAEQSDELLLFTDNNGNTWQIICRNDINVAGEELNEKAEGEDSDLACTKSKNTEELKKESSLNKSPANVEGVNFVKSCSSTEKHEHVSIIEEFEDNNPAPAIANADNENS